MTFAEFVHAELLRRAEDRAREGAASAGVYRRVAEDIVHWWREWHETPLALDVAVAESGYTVSGLRRYMKRRALAHLTRATLPKRPSDDEPDAPTVTVSLPPLPVALDALAAPQHPRRPVRARRGPRPSSLVATVLPGAR